jgi:hypothetical protein
MPISIDDARTLVDDKKLQILSYGAFGTDYAGLPVSLYVWPETQKIESLPSAEEVNLKGIMTITTLVKPEVSNLEALLADERIILVDFISTLVKEKIEAETGELIDVTQIGVPNPAWFLFTGELRMP